MKSGWNIVRRLRCGVLGLFVFLTGVLLSMPVAQADEEAQAPARAARLAYVEGQVGIAQGSQVLADPAPVNSPLFEGAEVTAGEDGRAEIQFEDGSVARLGPNSALLLKVLRPTEGGSETEIVLERGLGYFELQTGGDNDRFRVRFDDTVTTASGFTVMRINLDTPPGEVAVFSGNAHVERGDSLALDLHGGESVRLNANDATAYNLAESIEPDSWDAWNADRDRALQSETARKTQATQEQDNNPAWADLDANGNWYNVPGEGYVWSPYDAASRGWDPYDNGNWMWTPGYGYVWVSGYPWGYMPFQCGTWNYYGTFGWGWAPGAGYCRPWWGGGGGWVNRVGYGPSGYRFPIRPHPRPGPPRRPIGMPHEAGKTGPYPLVAVNRRPGGTLAAPNRPPEASIHGHTVQPLRPVAPRQTYPGVIGGGMGRQGAGYQGTRPVAMPPARGNGMEGGRPTYAPPARPTTSRPANNQPVYAPSRAPSAGVPPGGHPASMPSAPRAAPSAGGAGSAPHGGGGAPSGGGAPAGGGAGGSHGGGSGGPHH